MKVKSVVKQCTCCNKILPLNEFYKNKNSKDGYRNKCKVCEKQYIKEQYNKKHNRELIRKLVAMLEPIRNRDITTKELRKIKQQKGACYESKN